MKKIVTTKKKLTKTAAKTAAKTTVSKSVKTKKPALNNKEKTREEIEDMFNFGFGGCDCSSCHLHCGNE